MEKFQSRLSSPPTREDLTAALLAHVSGPDCVVRGSAAAVLADLDPVEFCKEICFWHSASPDSTVVGPPEKVVRAAFELSGGTLGSAFTNIFGSRLQAEYAQAPDKSAGWVSEQDLPNYLPLPLITVLDSVHLLPRGKGQAEILDVQAFGVQWQLADFCRALIVEGRDLAADLVGAVLQAARGLGRGARRLKDDSVFSVLLGNPLLADGNPLFCSAHNNLLTGGSSALSSTSLGQAIQRIRSQTFSDENGPVHWELSPHYLLVGPALEDAAKQIVRLRKMDDEREDLKVITTSRLSSAGIADPLTGVLRKGNDVNWLLCCDAFTCPIVAVGYLTGRREPEIRSYELGGPGPYAGTWGLGWDVHHAIAACACDYRGGVWSNGQ